LRRAIIVFALLGTLLTSCTSTIDNVQQAGHSRVQQFLAQLFGQKLLQGIDTVINQLASTGGFFNDPLVKILLPPPLGMVLGVAMDLHEHPDETLLVILINQAAENAIPVAGPILKNIITNMDKPQLQSLLDGDNRAATNYLKSQGGAAIKTVILPALSEQLHLNGAIELYGKMVKAKEEVEGIKATVSTLQQQVTEAEQLAVGAQVSTDIVAQADTVRQTLDTAEQQLAVADSASVDKLTDYVADQALAGLFKKFGTQEQEIRQQLEQGPSFKDLGLRF